MPSSIFGLNMRSYEWVLVPEIIFFWFSEIFLIVIPIVIQKRSARPQNSSYNYFLGDLGPYYGLTSLWQRKSVRNTFFWRNTNTRYYSVFRNHRISNIEYYSVLRKFYKLILFGIKKIRILNTNSTIRSNYSNTEY